MATPPQLKLRPWKVILDGVSQNIAVLSTGSPDAIVSGSGLTPRGLWTVAIAQAGGYGFNDLVQYGSGISAGWYFSTMFNNSNTPDSGIGWEQLSTLGQVWQ